MFTPNLFRRLALVAIIFLLGAGLLLWAFSWFNANQLRAQFLKQRQQSIEAFFEDIIGRVQNPTLLERSGINLFRFDPNIALIELRNEAGEQIWQLTNTDLPPIHDLLQIFGSKAVLIRPLQDLISQRGAIFFPFLPRGESQILPNEGLGLKAYFQVHPERLNFMLADALAESLIDYFLLFGLLLIYYLVLVYYLWPIREIRKGALAIADGNLSKEIKVRRQDELGTIATFFNEVVRNLNKVAKDLAYKERVAHELALAASIQEKLLPKDLPQLKGIEVAAKTFPAVEIGGDSYDFIKGAKGNTFIYIGDVTGHGVPAALVMTMMNVLMRAFRDIAKGPAELFALVNQTIFPRIERNMFMTAASLLWQENEQQLTYVNAGHEPPLIYRRASKSSELVKTKGIALGMLPDNKAQLEEITLNLATGDLLALPTDGILEAKNSYGEEYGLARLEQALVRYGHRDQLAEVIDGIIKDLAEFTGKDKEWEDDVTLLLVRRTP